MRLSNPEVSDMCLNCGCGMYETRHKDGDITLGDLKKAAKNHEMETEQAADNIHSAASDLKHAGNIS